MEKDIIERFEKLHLQIKDLYRELSILSKKSPNGAVNTFKLKFINKLIEEANDIMDEKYLPFEDFEKFDEEDIPFNSDVVMILSQYLKCLEKYKYDNVKMLSGNWYWNLTGSRDGVKTSSPLSELLF